MSDMTLTKRRIIAGVWEGILTGADMSSAPRLLVSADQVAFPDVTCEVDPDDPKAWRVTIPIPAAAIADGLQVAVITDAASGQTLGQIVLQCDDVAPDDLLAEVTLLRAELDMLKRAFRRHCVETAQT